MTGRVLVNGKHVQVRTSGEVKWNPDPKAVDVIVARAIGMIRKRTNEGVDGHGQPFKPYDPDYAKAKAEAGRSTQVNLTVTQTLLRSVAERARSILLDRAEVVIGPGQGPHPVYYLGQGKVSRTAWWEGAAREEAKRQAAKKTKAGRANARALRAEVKAEKERRAAKAPSTNSIGYWLHHGTPHMPARPWLMLSDEDTKRLGALIRRMAAQLFRPK